jgi:hypothetical protein
MVLQSNQGGPKRNIGSFWLEGQVETPAGQTNDGRDDQNGVFNFAIDGEVVLLGDNDTHNEPQGEHNIAVIFHPDRAQDEIDEDFQKIEIVAFGRELLLFGWHSCIKA